MPACAADFDIAIAISEALEIVLGLSAIGSQLESKHDEAWILLPLLVWRSPEESDRGRLAQLCSTGALKVCTRGLEIDVFGDNQSLSCPVSRELALVLGVVICHSA